MSHRRLLLAGVLVLAVAFPAHGQFLETFDVPALQLDPSGVDGWAFFTGDGEATIDLVATGDGHASIVVDARNDRRNVWWAIDWPVNATAGGKTWFVISRPVLQRLVDGRTLGLALTPLGPIDAGLRCSGADAPRLLFNLEP